MQKILMLANKMFNDPMVFFNFLSEHDGASMGNGLRTQLNPNTRSLISGQNKLFQTFDSLL